MQINGVILKPIRALILGVLVLFSGVPIPAPDPGLVLLLEPQDARPVGQPLAARIAAAVSTTPSSAQPKVLHMMVAADGSDAANALRDAGRQGRVLAGYALSMEVARAVQIAAPALPLVFDGAADPLLMCLVSSLVRPGAYSTGATTDYPADAKLVEVLLDAFPRLRRVQVLLDGNNLHPDSCNVGTASSSANHIGACMPGVVAADQVRRVIAYADQLEAYARRRGVALELVRLCSSKDVVKLSQTLASDRNAGGVVVPLHLLFYDNAGTLAQALNAAAVPAVYAGRAFIKAGGLMAIEPVVAGERHSAAIDLLLQVLRGRSPADLPVQLPRGFELWINHDAITAPHLRPSLKALRRADGFVGTPR